MDARGVLVYAGKPCDGGPPSKLGFQDNSIARVLDDLVAGKAVQPRQTKPWGCTIKRVKPTPRPATPAAPAVPAVPTAPEGPEMPAAPNVPDLPVVR